MCGPLIPLTNHTYEAEKAQSVKFEEISRLLDSVLESRGSRALIYASAEILCCDTKIRMNEHTQISLGSLFWSKEPEKIWAFVGVLMELGRPFVCLSACLCRHILTRLSDHEPCFSMGCDSRGVGQKS